MSLILPKAAKYPTDAGNAVFRANSLQMFSLEYLSCDAIDLCKSDVKLEAMLEK